MARCDRETRALRQARVAYQRTRVASAVRGVVLAAALAMLAFGLHHMSSASWLVAVALAAVLGILGWWGGAWRRGALAGVASGIPPLIAPSIAFALMHGKHCASCQHVPALSCLITSFVISSLVGILVGHHAATEPSPRRFAIAAIASAALTGLMGCVMIGLGGAVGVVIGLVAGGVTGWVVAMRTAHA